MQANQIKALVVDDDPKFLEIMKQTLESKDCFVQCVSEKQKALSLLMNEVFHLVFIDCILHSGQGTELIQEIRKALGYSVEIIMISGVVPEKSLSNYIDVGICNFLSKPISDKEIEENLKFVKEKIIYGKKQNILVKLFSQYSFIQKLKFLVSLKRAKSHEFFIYLGSLLSSKESLSVTFKLNNKQHKIVCNKGAIIEYGTENSEVFLNKLLSQKLITDQEKNQLRGASQKENVNSLLKNCILSSSQISDTKYDMLIETLKEIIPGIEIPFSVHLITPEKDPLLLLNQSEYADLVFSFLKQKFNNHLFSYFNEEIMEQSVIFENSLKNYIPEVESFISDLKSGMKLKTIYDKYINDKNIFYSYFFYTLLKGNAYISQSNLNIKYYYLYERYQSLYKFMNQFKQPEKFFSYLNGSPGVPQVNVEEIKATYFYFIKHNHPDKFSFDVPQDLLDLISKILSKTKYFFDLSSNPALKAKSDEKKKKEEIQTAVLFAEKKKICERYLENNQYMEAFSLMETIPKKTVDKEIHWQFFYLWLYFESNDEEVDANQVHEYMKNIQAQSRSLTKEKLYHYTLGLYHESKKNYKQAQACFKKTKLLDPSFQSCYPAMNRCSLELIREQQSSQPVFSKLMKSFNGLRKKQKKTG